MILIAHRGNLNGPDPLNENSLDKIKYALSEGYDAEIDVWSINGVYFLGHDGPLHKLNEREFLKNSKLWCHAKNLEALERLLEDNCHCFWHQSDDFTLTSKGYIWTYPGRNVSRNSVCVTNEKTLTQAEYNVLKKSCAAICSDYALILRGM